MSLSGSVLGSDKIDLQSEYLGSKIDNQSKYFSLSLDRVESTHTLGQALLYLSLGPVLDCTKIYSLSEYIGSKNRQSKQVFLYI